ncbi:hypothetical protein [Phormidesmis priestleyi]|uniref:hypothetical protein n=1 Tax=Phormidesmis priestleyi TaxID=268141 RepID=UPI0009F81A4F
MQQCSRSLHVQLLALTLALSFGSYLSIRKFDHQAVELFIKGAALNRMIQICKPDSYEVEA